MLLELFLFSFLTFAGDDAVDQNALKEAQAQLARSQNDPKTDAVFSDLRKRGIDSKTEAEIMQLAADILGSIGSQAQSNSDLEKIISDAQKNPTDFATRFTPEQRAKLKQIADKIDASKKSK